MSALREVTWRDIPQLAALETELFADDAWTVETWWAELAGRPRRAYLVLDGEGGVEGYAGLDHGGDVADVMTVAVVPAHRGRGLGDLLLEELLRLAADGGAGAVMLEVRADNVAARRLYERHGFEEVSVRRRYYRRPGAPDVDAVVMRCRLGGGLMRDEPLVLGIETSCDETGVGIVRGETLLVDAVASSVDEHARFGGVVPEVASRAHLEAMVPTIERACRSRACASPTSTRSPSPRDLVWPGRCWSAWPRPRRWPSASANPSTASTTWLARGRRRRRARTASGTVPRAPGQRRPLLAAARP